MSEATRAGSWTAAAERFYDAEARVKALPARHRLFASSYRPVLSRLGVGKGARILDAGCGCGELLAAAEGEPVKVVGADLSRASLAQARAFHPGGPFLGADLARLPFRDGSFDAVVAVTSVEFCPDRAAVLREFRRLLRGRGRLYLDVRNSDFLPFRALRPILPVLQGLGLLEPYPAEGFRDLSCGEWAEACAAQGFRIVSLHPSVWPWNFGSPATRAKNLVIEAVKAAARVENQYMIGFLLEKPG